MPNTKTITVDFFRVELDPTTLAARGFSDIIDQAMSLPRSQRVVQHHDSYLRLEGMWDETRSIFAGIIHKLRTDQSPIVSTIDGSSERIIELQHNEGLNEDTHFAYSPRTGCIVLQRNWNYGVRHTAFCRYFEDLFNIQGISLTPLCRGNPEDTLNRMTIIRRLDTKIATPIQEPQAYHSIATALRMTAEISKSEWVVLTIGVNRGKGKSLDDQVKQLARELRRYPDIQRLRVSGAEPGGTIEILDLLEDRIWDRVKVPLTGGKVISRDEVASRLRDVYNKHSREIERLYGTRAG